MTTLHVIRHGKAMAGAERYDQLHALGQKQARLLGEHLREKSVFFDAIYCGPLSRQVDTLAHMRSAAGDVGAMWPEAVILPELAEAPIEPLARHCMTERLATDARLQSLMSELASSGRAAADDAFFEAMLAYVVDLWLSGEVRLPEIETAAAFGQRVRAGLERILKGAAQGRHVAVVTSNGVIGWLAGYAESETEPERACLLRRLFNASISRFTEKNGRLEVSAWNTVDHLAESELRTIL